MPLPPPASMNLCKYVLNLYEQLNLVCIMYEQLCMLYIIYSYIYIYCDCEIMYVIVYNL
jgi:hypothetical protein